MLIVKELLAEKKENEKVQDFSWTLPVFKDFVQDWSNGELEKTAVYIFEPFVVGGSCHAVCFAFSLGIYGSASSCRCFMGLVAFSWLKAVPGLFVAVLWVLSPSCHRFFFGINIILSLCGPCRALPWSKASASGLHVDMLCNVRWALSP